MRSAVLYAIASVVVGYVAVSTGSPGAGFASGTFLTTAAWYAADWWEAR